MPLPIKEASPGVHSHFHVDFSPLGLEIWGYPSFVGPSRVEERVPRWREWAFFGSSIISKTALEHCSLVIFCANLESSASGRQMHYCTSVCEMYIHSPNGLDRYWIELNGRIVRRHLLTCANDVFLFLTIAQRWNLHLWLLSQLSWKFGPSHKMLKDEIDSSEENVSDCKMTAFKQAKKENVHFDCGDVRDQKNWLRWTGK